MVSEHRHDHPEVYCRTCVEYGVKVGAQEGARFGAEEASRVWEAKMAEVVRQAEQRGRDEVVTRVLIEVTAPGAASVRLGNIVTICEHVAGVEA